MSIKILKKYKIKAKKSLWQNFLVNDLMIDDISNIIEIQNKNIIEVWPWYGVLTKKLLEKNPKSLNLIELDKNMVNILEKRKNNWDFNLDWINFKIDNIDILKYLPNYSNYNVIANIPYYITSPILKHFLYILENKPEKMVILMQKDVGDKILWKWKNKSSVLSLFIAKKCYIKEVLLVWRENFIPMPKVESSVLFFELHNVYKDIDDSIFLDIIKKGFLSPRKKLIKNLISGWFKKEFILNIFDKLWIEEWIRGEDLDIDVWSNLVSKLNI